MFSPFDLSEQHYMPLDLSKPRAHCNAEKFSTYSGNKYNHRDGSERNGYEYEMGHFNQNTSRVPSDIEYGQHNVSTHWSVPARQFPVQSGQYPHASDNPTTWSNIQTTNKSANQFPIKRIRYDDTLVANNPLALEYSYYRSYNETKLKEGMATYQSNQATDRFNWNNSYVAPERRLFENLSSVSSNSLGFGNYKNNMTPTKLQDASSGVLSDGRSCSSSDNGDIRLESGHTRRVQKLHEKSSSTTTNSLTYNEYPNYTVNKVMDPQAVSWSSRDTRDPTNNVVTNTNLQLKCSDASSTDANSSTNNDFSNHTNDFLSVKAEPIYSEYFSDSRSSSPNKNMDMASTNRQLACSEQTKPVPSAVKISNSFTDNGFINHTNDIIPTTSQAVSSGYESDSRSRSPKNNIYMTTSTNPQIANLQLADNSVFFSNTDNITTDMAANEMLRQAFQCGRQPRLANYDFVLDRTQTSDFAVKDWSIPRPVIRLSKSKFYSIFHHNERMERRFKAPANTSDPDLIVKDRRMRRLQARIAAATTDLEYFILINMTRHKAMLLKQYQVYNNVLRLAVEELENK